MSNPEGCGSRLRDTLNREGKEWALENELYLLNEMHANAKKNSLPWDREAVREVIQKVVAEFTEPQVPSSQGFGQRV